MFIVRSIVNRENTAMRFIISIYFLLVASNAFASSASDVRKGNRLYYEGKFDESIAHYEKAVGAKQGVGIVDYDLGAAYYKKGDFSKAMEYWQKSSAVKDKVLSAQAQYNLGNALYKDALAEENSSLDRAIAKMEKAENLFQQLVTDNPKDTDAAFNQQRAKEQLERLRKKKQEQQQQQQDSKDQDKQEKKDQQDQQKSDQQQDKKDEQEQQEQSNNEQKQNQEDQQMEDKKQDKKDSQQSKDKSSEDKDKKDKKQETLQPQEQAVDPKELQAQAMLEEYERNEQPKQLLQFVPKSNDESPVSKDW